MISETAANVDSRWGFEVGQSVGMLTLMRATAVVSSNEAANALAEWQSGSIERFTERLNEFAGTIGMNATLVSSPSGLGRPQSMTAHDALILARHVLSHHPRVAVFCAKKQFIWRDRRYPTVNRLVRVMDGADGLKTGTIVGHTYNLILSVRRNGNRFIAIVLGASNKDERDDIAVRMIDEACPE